MIRCPSSEILSISIVGWILSRIICCCSRKMRAKTSYRKQILTWLSESVVCLMVEVMEWGVCAKKK